MNTKEIQKRNGKSKRLRVLRTNENLYAESEEGKILYKLNETDDGISCTCGDYARGVKSDTQFHCKHIMSYIDSVPNGDAENAEFLEKRKPKLDERFIINIKGRDFVVYSGLLDLAHQKGLLKLNTEIIQYPTKENGNLAISRAIAELNTGEMFSDIGDAGPGNVTKEIAPHILRMSSTRAKGRVLRDLTNIGMTCLEELGNLDDVIGIGNNQKTRSKKVSPIKESKSSKPEPKKEEPKGKKEEAKPEIKKPSVSSIKPEPKTDDSKEETAPKMSEAQKRAVYNLSRRRGISVDELDKMATDTYGVKVEFLTTSDASAFIKNLQQAS
jgi:hypothetical protein